ncbi:preprotein translocase subunit SecD [Moraxella macacae 0408225]|uniref:Protein translocase subunit SecD n=1 Tax=Moraxella macacae 0408225 TaxID=1230338 RepID=L2F5U0_9GAMM|nr:protein translocase subunit SecD [Moraxella macacae]ELA08397.1 preprotein translocase subunit SecD [Moraxella macacae 0408225]
MQYPIWKYVLIGIVLLVSSIYALPNLYPDKPAVQVTGSSASTVLTDDVLTKAEQILNAQGIKTTNNSFDGNSALLKIADESGETQIKAQQILREKLGDNYVVALNLAQTTPEWLRKIGAAPVKLGLDLRGGVRFVMEVDMSKTISQRLEAASQDVRNELHGQQITLDRLSSTKNGLNLTFSDNAQRDKALNTLRNRFGANYHLQPVIGDKGASINMTLTETALAQISQDAVTQNLTTMRNRINELGVAEAVVQSQGSNRIVVELPGVQDTAEAKRVIGRTANLEFRMVANENNNWQANPSQILPPGTESYSFGEVDSPQKSLLERQPIVTGQNVQDAQAGLDHHGMPQVSITLDSQGGKLMQNTTAKSVGKQMAVLFIENKQRISFETDPLTGENKEVRTPYSESRIINQATIQGVFGSTFQITGLDNNAEASELALLLRAGALAAPMYFVEERTIGPSLGQDNIEKGIFSTQVGYLLVFLFMLVFYRLFGLIANIALAFNLMMILAIMSILGSALTLPGIAGIVLTIGMAVDANVLIFERIREELTGSTRPKSAIVAGFNRAFSSIFDAQITTLLVAFILFAIGTGPIKGFAVTLAIGITSSIFTSVTVTRALVQIFYGYRKSVKRLSIG